MTQYVYIKFMSTSSFMCICTLYVRRLHHEACHQNPDPDTEVSHCMCRFRELQTQTGEQNKGRWTPEESKKLQEAVEEYLTTKQVILTLRTYAFADTSQFWMTSCQETKACQVHVRT